MPFEVQSNCRIVLYNRVWDLTWSMKLSTPYGPKGDTLRLTNIGLR